MTAGSGFELTVTAEDAEGNLVTGFNGDELVTLLTNPGGGLLGGPIDVSATNGVAVFSGLTLSSGGSGLTLQVSSPGVTPFVSNSITVDQPPFITSSSSATFIAGSAGTFTVTASAWPTPIMLYETETLPAGVTFNGITGLLSVSATAAVGTYPIEFTAHNGIGNNGTQAFVLNIVPNSMTVSDGGFETPGVGSGSSGYQYDPAGSPWTFTGHAGISGNSSNFTSGSPNAPEGVQVAFLQNTGSASESISFQPGTYMVTFDAAQRENISSNQTVEVLIDGNVVSSITPSGTNYASYSTQGFTITTTGMHALTFEGLPPSSDPRGGEYDTAFIDAVTISASQPNQPFDPGFESPSVGSGSSAYQYDPASSPWTFSGDAGVTGNASGYTANNPNAPQGSQVAFVQCSGSASQSFYMTPGVYDVNLLAAQRGIGPSDQTIEVLVDGQLVSTITPAGTSYASYTSGSFVIGTAGSHTLSFVGQDPLGGDNTAFIDQVTVQNVMANQPFDPGFESPDLGTGQAAYQYNATGSPWRFDGDAGVAANGSSFTLNNPNAPQGSQVAFLQFTGSASQVVTLSGGTYSISLDAAQRNIAQVGGQTIEVLVDGAPVGSITPGGTNYALYSTATFYAAAGAHTIEILGLDPQGSDNTALVDQVSVVAVQANQPLDSGFEAPPLGSGASAYEYNPTNSPWTFSGDAGVAGNASSFTLENPTAPQGEQVAFLQFNGSVSQSFTMAPGVYDVNLLAAQRAIGSSQQTIQVFVDGQLVSSITPSGTSYASYTSGAFAIGIGGSHTLSFFGLDPLGGDNTAFIDQVSVQNVTTNQPADAGFESPFAGPTAYQYDPTGSAWIYSGYAGVAANASGVTSGNPNAPQGSQVAFIQMGGSASQVVTLAAGTYSISLDAAQRTLGSSKQTIEVLVDGTPVSSITPTSFNYELYATTTFSATAGAHTIEILGLDPQGGDNTALIDLVSIVAAPSNQPLDPGFEAPSLGAGVSAYQYDPGSSPWAFSGFAGVTGNGSAFTAGGPSAPQCGQAAFIQMTGSLSQSVTLASGTYSLSLEAAQRANVAQPVQTIEVLVDGASGQHDHAVRHELRRVRHSDVHGWFGRPHHRAAGPRPARRRQYGLRRRGVSELGLSAAGSQCGAQEVNPRKMPRARLAPPR